MLSIFRENFVNKLRGSIRENYAYYSHDEPWVEELGGKANTIGTSVEPTEEIDLAIPDGDDLKDVENSIKMHRALSFLTPLQARDPRLWTRLAHCECWEYMRARW